MMNVSIKKLDSKIINDYLTFFGNIITIDKSECGNCYCMFFHTDEKAKEWMERKKETNKNDAVKDIKTGKLSGFLAYDGNKPIAWCNVNERNVFKFNKSRFNILNDGKKVISIVCFYIMQEYRGKGISNILLNYIIDYYKSYNYDYIEAYPAVNKLKSNENYHGILSSFLKSGFSIFKEMEEIDDFGDYEKYNIVRYYYK
jgi:GNAT superfamily N-acetyltransferase